MEDFIRAQVKELKRTPNVRMPRPAQCLIVTELAAPSLAAHAGVAVKDFLVSVDGTPAVEVGTRTFVSRASERRWVFYSRARHEQIDLLATGIEPGVELELTVDAVKQLYDPKEGSPVELEALWAAREWRALQDCATRTLAAFPGNHDRPALVFQGAALYEQGRRAEGLALVNEYVDRFAAHWTMNFTGIGYYYQALGLMEAGEKERGTSLLLTAFEYNRCPRLAEAVEKHTGERLPLEEGVWIDRAFPVSYDLPRLEAGGERVRLQDTLAGLGPRQGLVVCLLASYRGNGPYNEFMLRYHNFATWFGDYLKGLHVITMEPERPKERSYYFRAEDAIREAGLPLELLLEDGSIASALELTTSPFIVLLDSSGRIRHERELSGVDVWRALVALQASPPHA
jgi:hypothetical protein